MIKKHIPNSITLLNLFSGFCTILFATSGNTSLAVWMMGFAILFDFCDGLVARVLHVKSALGKQLDSLSDLVSFGVAPATILYQSFLQHGNFSMTIGNLQVIPLIVCALFPCMGAIRLGKFNMDERQTENFRGMPIPLAAFSIVSLCAIPTFPSIDIVYILAVVLLSTLMLSDMPLFSLKFKNLRFRENWYRYTLILAGLLLFALLRLPSILPIVCIYLLLSFIVRKKITA